jgi:glutathionyl-hydroquinone reductase
MATLSSSTSSGSAGITTDDQTNAAERRMRGEFVRGVSTARHWIQENNTGPYPPAFGRYHLIVAYNCPWCHRVLLGRSVMGLEEAVSVDVCFPNRSTENDPGGADLWKFSPGGVLGSNGRFVKFDECTDDTVMGGKRNVKEIYEAAGVVDQTSLPILLDKETKTIVSNESAEILRMFGTVMRPFASRKDKVDLYPIDKQKDIDVINDFIYTEIANGSYKAGFSSSQEKYEQAYTNFFVAMEKVDDILSRSIFLMGDSVTEADLRLFPPMFRFDSVYCIRMKLNKYSLWHYRHIWRWMGDIMRLEGIEPVANRQYLQHCKQGYFGRTGNGVIPFGPEGYPECFLEPHWTHLLDRNSRERDMIHFL